MTTSRIFNAVKNSSFLILLPLFFVLHQYNQHYPSVMMKDAWTMFFIFSGGCILLYLLFFLFTKKVQASLMATALVALPYLFFGAIHDTLKNLLPVAGRYIVLIPALVTMVAFACYKVFRKQQQQKKWLQYLNLLFLLLLLIESAQLISSETETHTAIPGTICDTCIKPDIYLIVADEYAGELQLQKAFGFDNSRFYRALEERGFKIIGNSFSNYNSTAYSMASMFSMDLIEGLKSNRENQHDLDRCIGIIRQNSLTHHLKQLRYKIVNNSVFEFDDQPAPSSSMFFITGKQRIHYQTLSGRIKKDLGFNLVTRWKWKWLTRKKAENNLAAIEKKIQFTMDLATESHKAPLFIYTHLMMPHFPYYLDSNGKMGNLDHIAKEEWSDRESYLQYLLYTNRRLIDMADEIRERARKPFIILMMSDHGFRYGKEQDKDLQFLNLAAYYDSNNKLSIPEGTSNVNLLRIIMNTYFRLELPAADNSKIFIE